MALKNLKEWAANGSACGSVDKPSGKPSACGSSGKPSACGSSGKPAARGSKDKPSACGASRK